MECAKQAPTKVSPLTEGRGLKHAPVVVPQPRGLSPLTEGRGLKRRDRALGGRRARVAPHRGAWIETVRAARRKWRAPSPLTEGRGLKLQGIRDDDGYDIVSPLTEGRGLKRGILSLINHQLRSPLTEGRGLKHVKYLLWAKK